MEDHDADLRARAIALFKRQREQFSGGGCFVVWTESEERTRREISAMASEDRIKFQSDVWSRIDRDDVLDGRRRLDHVREHLQARRTDEALEALSGAPQGTFEEWFWKRCQRLGIEEEFRAKFEEWKRSRRA